MIEEYILFIEQAWHIVHRGYNTTTNKHKKKQKNPKNQKEKEKKTRN